MVPITVPANFRIIAHRGASAYTPENTAAAFKLAADMGAREFETDVRLTADGIVVLMHDGSLKRFGHGAVTVEESQSEELNALDMGSWFSPFLFAGEKMLTLEELFSTHGDKITYHLEIKKKTEGLPEKVLRAIRKFDLEESCIITSFSFDALSSMRALTGDLCLGWLVKHVDEQVCENAAGLGLFQLCPKAEIVTPELVEVCRKTVQEVRAWGISGKPQEIIELIRQVVRGGCDGMTINWPDWVVHPS